MSPREPREPASTSGTPEPDRGPGGALWRALRFPFTLRRRLRSSEARLDRLEADLPARLDRLEAALAAADEHTIAALGDLRSRLDRLGGALSDLGDGLAQRHEDTVRRFEQAEGAIRAVQGEVELLRDTRAADLERRLDRAEAGLRETATGLGQLRDEVLPAAVDRGNVLVDRLAEQLEEVGSLVERILRTEPLPVPLPAAEEDHLAAELGAVTSRVLSAFRGDEVEIRHRLDRYLPPLRAAEPVLDLGCGRGELLLLLREAGVPASGVDGDPALVEAARRRGLEVTHGDVLETLRQLPDGSRGAVTAIHLLEHLPPTTLLATLVEVRRVLRPAGLLVAECPNPHCLRVGASLYWRDPTHQHPLLPETLELFVTAAGLAVEEVELLHPFPEEQRLGHGLRRPVDPDPPVAGLAAEVRGLEQRLDELLNGPRDFVLFARRPEGGA